MQLLIPSTYGIDERDEKLRVHKYGMLARAAAIFGVDRVTIYKDDDPKADEERNSELLRKHLEYAECPPYLRKALIPHDPDLSNANILPALQILSHGYSDRFREAVVEDVADKQSVLDAGLDKDVTVPGALEDGERVTVRMVDETSAEIVAPQDIEGFWTFTVEERRDQLGAVLDDITRPVIGTSRQGEGLPTFTESRFASEKDVAVVFGSPWRGIPDLVERGDCTADQFAMTVNFVPGQQTKTVRTDEAVPIVLGVMNAFRQ